MTKAIKKNKVTFRVKNLLNYHFTLSSVQGLSQDATFQQSIIYVKSCTM